MELCARTNSFVVDETTQFAESALASVRRRTPMHVLEIQHRFATDWFSHVLSQSILGPRYSHGAQSFAAIAGHPIHPLLVPIAIGLYAGAVCADLAFARTGDVFWARSASWLLLGTLISAGIAALAGLIDLISIERARRLVIAWGHAIGNFAFWFLTLWNYWRRQPDPTAHHTDNLIISLVGLAVMGLAGWFGGEMSFKHGIGVSRGIGAVSDRVI